MYNVTLLRKNYENYLRIDKKLQARLFQRIVVHEEHVDDFIL